MSTTYEQQPIGLVVGRRRPRDGAPLDAATRARMTELARYRTCAPKGVFIYDSPDEMEADRLRWVVEAMLRKAASR